MPLPSLVPSPSPWLRSQLHRGAAIAVAAAAVCGTQSALALTRADPPEDGGGSASAVLPAVSDAVIRYLLNGNSGSSTFVAGSTIHLADWKLKPICRSEHGEVSVLGFLAIDTSGVDVGSNLTSVFFEKTEDTAQRWTARTWPMSSSQDIVRHLKLVYGIPNDQDWLWEIPVPASSTEGAALPPTAFDFEDGFVHSDPLREVVAALPEPSREMLIQGLKQSGYMVADISIASLDPLPQREFLDSAACYIAMVAGTGTNPLLSAIAAEDLPNFDGDEPIRVDPVRFDPQLHPDGPLPGWLAPFNGVICGVNLLLRDLDGCKAETLLTGEWLPAETPCDCTTVGPSPFGEFEGTAGANGELEFWLPHPMPKGTFIRIRLSVGLTFRTYVCLWTRTCTARTKRWVVKRHSDCSVWAHPEYGPDASFTQIGWSLAARPEDCGTSARPPEIPPNEQECGLTNPTAP